MMEDRAQLQAVVRGHVQGVGFRYFVLDRADELGLCGYVRNLSDGRTIEVVAEGSRTALEALLGRLQSGPRGSRVESIESHWGPQTGAFQAFEVRH